eukprot:4542697-Pyramimonas_sp.AAC.1
MDPLVFHTRDIGSAQDRKRMYDTIAHPNRDPSGSIGALTFSVQEERTFGLGMYDDIGDLAVLFGRLWGPSSRLEAIVPSWAILAALVACRGHLGSQLEHFARF